MELTLYETCWMFFIYGFLGWCAEVAFAAVRTGKFVNRGFLNGPICPIYGFGVVLVLSFLLPLRMHILWLFVGAVLLTSVLEYLTGYLLEKVFHDKWWDYSDMPLNIHGYICLLFSVLWGLACMVIVYGVHPWILRLVRLVPHTFGMVLLFCLFGLLLADTIVTGIAVQRLPKRLQTITELGDKLRQTSDSLGKGISDGAIALRDKNMQLRSQWQDTRQRIDLAAETRKQSFRIEVEQYRQRVEELQKKYWEQLEMHNWNHRRLLKAFPRLQKGKYQRAISSLKQYWEEKKQQDKNR